MCLVHNERSIWARYGFLPARAPAVVVVVALVQRRRGNCENSCVYHHVIVVRAHEIFANKNETARRALSVHP